MKDWFKDVGESERFNLYIIVVQTQLPEEREREIMHKMISKYFPVKGEKEMEKKK